MPSVILPAEPSLEQLRRQARDLQRAVRAADPAALAEVAGHYPGDAPAGAVFPLSAAQLVVARQHGFLSWPRLRRHVEAVQRYSRFPGRLGAAGDLGGPAGEFLRRACLSYEDDGPQRWAEARQLLRDHPELTRASAPAAAAAADTAALEQILAADPAAARREGGPYRWKPLVYLAYARHDPAIGRDSVLRAARLLLAAGADPNAGYLWHGLPTPFTVLTGALGEGELGPQRQPRHPHWRELGRLLLQAGADPSDGQGLYNRQFEPGTEHLELLLEFGLGTGDGGPWRRRLGDALGTPADEVRGQLGWAIAHGMADRVRLLAEHGADITTPGADGVTPAGYATATGHPEIAGYLVSRGAAPPRLDPAAALAAAALAGRAGEAAALLAADPGLAPAVRRDRPGLIVWAAAQGAPAAAGILAAAGWDVNARGRSDVPSDMPWHTALHAAVEAGRPDVTRALLALGADPGLRDQRFGGTPLDWARHFGREELIALLEPVTVEPPPGEPPPREPPPREPPSSGPEAAPPTRT
ncbi:MAG TPA: ankyrin repeat domain-containing protein [Streptosporangiaceae bacterium]